MRKTEKRQCKHHGTWDHRNYDGIRYRCLACESERKKKHRDKLKIRLMSEFGGSCQICGYNKCFNALDFHHVDPSIKEFGIGSTGWMKGYNKIRKEADKCVMICSNCHAEVHAGLIPLESLTNLVGGRTLTP